MFYLHDQLMGAGHQGEAVGVVEGFRDVLSEGVAGTSGGDAPPAAIIRIRPQQVTHRALRERQRVTAIIAVPLRDKPPTQNHFDLTSCVSAINACFSWPIPTR